MSPNAGGCCGVSANEYSCAHGAQINFGDLTPYLTYGTLIKKENKIFLLYKEIQSGAVAKSYMTNGLLIYGEIFTHFLIY
jgi:hypothetical protein